MQRFPSGCDERKFSRNNETFRVRRNSRRCQHNVATSLAKYPIEEKHPQTHNIPIGRIASWSRSIYRRSLDGQKSRFRVPLFFDLFYGPAIRDLDLVFYWRRKSISDVSGCLPTGRIGRVPRKIDSRSAMFGANVASGFALRSI